MKPQTNILSNNLRKRFCPTRGQTQFIHVPVRLSVVSTVSGKRLPACVQNLDAHFTLLRIEIQLHASTCQLEWLGYRVAERLAGLEADETIQRQFRQTDIGSPVVLEIENP